MKSLLQSKLWIIAGLISFGVYYNALFNGFIWDDPVVLQKQINVFHSIIDIFSPPIGIPQYSLFYYRPLIIISYKIDQALWGSSPFGFHLSVILFHCLNTILVFFISRRLLKKYEYKNIGALISSLVFGVHPIHTESVAWMAGRSDVIAAFFLFLSLILYFNYKDNKGRHWIYISSIIFLCACLTKETSIIFVILLPVIDICFFKDSMFTDTPDHDVKIKKMNISGKIKDKNTKQALIKKQAPVSRKINYINVYTYFPFILAVIICFILRNSALKAESQKVIQTVNIFEIIKIIINAYGFYVGKCFLPINLKAFIPEVPSSFLTTVFNFIIVLILLWGIIFSYLKRESIILFLIVFFMLTLLPSISVSIMKVAQTPLAERYLYIPLFSFSMLTGFVFLEIFTKFRKAERDSFLFRPAIVCIIIIALLIGYSIKTIYRNQIWKDDIRFWEELVRQYPGEGLPHQNLGKAYEGQNRIEDAEREYITAIKAKYDDEGRSIAYNNLGNIHLREKKYDEAEQCFEKAISIQPDFSAPYCGIGWILLTKYYNNLQEGEKPERKFLERPIKYLNIAIQLNPQFVKAHSLLGNAFFMLKDFDKAKIHIQSVIKYGGEGADVELAKKILYYIQSQ